MWKKTNEEMAIRFVDFVVASFLDDYFDEGIRAHISNREFRSSHYYWQETARASVKHDAWFVYIYSQMVAAERKESYEAGCERNIDGIVTNYRKVVERLRSNGHFLADLNEWFDAVWN